LTLIKPLDFGRGSADGEREAHSLSVSFVDRRTEPAERPLPASRMYRRRDGFARWPARVTRRSCDF
jgi:hypothetical protein